MDTEIETFFDVQVIYLEPNARGFRILNTNIIRKSVCFVHKLANYKQRSKLLYGKVQLNSLSATKPIEVFNVELLPKYLGYNFLLEQCFENKVSIEYYKLKMERTKIMGFHSNSVPARDPRAVRFFGHITSQFLSHRFLEFLSSNFGKPLFTI